MENVYKKRSGNVSQKETTLSFEEYKLHFSIWALFGSPLMIGCDVRNMTDETKVILMNREVLAISQDAACNQIILHRTESSEQFIACRLLENGDVAVGIFNMGDEPSARRCCWLLPGEFGWTAESGTKLLLRDLWTGEEKILDNDIINEEAQAPHTCRLFRVSLVKK